MMSNISFFLSVYFNHNFYNNFRKIENLVDRFGADPNFDRGTPYVIGERSGGFRRHEHCYWKRWLNLRKFFHFCPIFKNGIFLLELFWPTVRKNCSKAKLLQEGIFFLLQLFARDVLVMKTLEIEKTKPTFIISTFKTNQGRHGSQGCQGLFLAKFLG